MTTHFVFHAQDHAENVGVKGSGEAPRRLLGDRANLTFGAGIVRRDIETTKPRNGLVDHIADVIVLTEVGVDKLGLCA